MLIVCPACASEYEIETDRLGANGRSVRCAACRETWFIAPDAVAGPNGDAEPDVALSPEASASEESTEAATVGGPSVAAPDGPETLDQPMPFPRRAKPAPKKPLRPRVKRALSLPLAAGLAAFAVVPLALLGRGMVVQAMPQTAGLFAAAGLPVNLRGVGIRDVAAFQTPAEADRPGELVVEGDLVGVARERVDVAEITVEVRDAHDQVVHRWTVPAPRTVLENGEKARFKASLSAPPAQGRSVHVRFAQAKAEDAGQAQVGHVEAAPTEHAPEADATVLKVTPPHVAAHGH